MSEVCHCCFGAGVLAGEGYAECPYCDGTGWIDEREYEEEEEDEES